MSSVCAVPSSVHQPSVLNALASPGSASNADLRMVSDAANTPGQIGHGHFHQSDTPSSIDSNGEAPVKLRKEMFYCRQSKKWIDCPPERTPHKYKQDKYSPLGLPQNK